MDDQIKTTIIDYRNGAVSSLASWFTATAKYMPSYFESTHPPKFIGMSDEALYLLTTINHYILLT